MAVDGATPVEGSSFDLKVTADDVDGGNLTYTLSKDGTPEGSQTVAAGDEVTFTVTVGTAGIISSYEVSITDGEETILSSVAVIPLTSNVAPVFSSGLAVSGGGVPDVGDQFDIVFTVTDGNQATLTVTITSTAGDSQQKL